MRHYAPAGAALLAYPLLGSALQLECCPNGKTIVEHQPVVVVYPGPPASSLTTTQTRTYTVPHELNTSLPYETIIEPGVAVPCTALGKGDAPGTVYLPDKHYVTSTQAGLDACYTITRKPGVSGTIVVPDWPCKTISDPRCEKPYTVPPSNGGSTATVVLPVPYDPGYVTITADVPKPTTVPPSGTNPGTIILPTSSALGDDRPPTTVTSTVSGIENPITIPGKPAESGKPSVPGTVLLPDPTETSELPGVVTSTTVGTGTETSTSFVPPSSTDPGTVIIVEPTLTPPDENEEVDPTVRPPVVTVTTSYTGTVTRTETLLPADPSDPTTVIIEDPSFTEPPIVPTVTVTTSYTGTETRTETLPPSDPSDPTTVIIEDPSYTETGVPIITVTVTYTGSTTNTETLPPTDPTDPTTVIIEDPDLTVVPTIIIPTDVEEVVTNTSSDETTTEVIIEVPTDIVPTITIPTDVEEVVTTTSIDETTTEVIIEVPTDITEPPVTSGCSLGLGYALYSLSMGDGRGQIPDSDENFWVDGQPGGGNVRRMFAGQTPAYIDETDVFGKVLGSELYGRELEQTSYFGVMHIGYFHPNTAGPYSFAFPQPIDDGEWLWIGDQAVAGPSNDNAYIVNARGRVGNQVSYEVTDDEVDTFIPIRILFVNAQAVSEFSFVLRNPDGEVIASDTVPSTDGQLVHDCENVDAPEIDYPIEGDPDDEDDEEEEEPTTTTDGSASTTTTEEPTGPLTTTVPWYQFTTRTSTSSGVVVIQTPLSCDPGLRWSFYGLEPGLGEAQIPRSSEASSLQNWGDGGATNFDVQRSLTGASAKYDGITRVYGRPTTSYQNGPNVPYYGQQLTQMDQIYSIMLHSGFFRPMKSGRYLFNLAQSNDEIALIWFGETAVAGWNNQNAALRQYFFKTVDPDYVYDVAEADVGIPVPFRLLFANSGGASSSSFTLTDPDGEVVASDTKQTDQTLSYRCDPGLNAPAISNPNSGGSGVDVDISVDLPITVPIVKALDNKATASSSGSAQATSSATATAQSKPSSTGSAQPTSS